MQVGSVSWTPTPGSGTVRALALLLALASSLLGVRNSIGADLGETQRALLRGEYAATISQAQEALANEPPNEEEWHQVLVRALLSVGRYREAASATERALNQVPRSVTLRWLSREAFTAVGKTDLAAERVAEIPRLVSQRPWSYRNPADLVAVGRALLAAGADPKEILDRVYATAQKAAPDLRDVYLAIGELALEKGDFALAAKQFDEALKRLPEDPDLLCGRARAFAFSDRQETGKSLEAALQANPRHIPSLLLLADHRIDAEDYDGATETLDQIRAINPAHPEAWTYTAVIAHLRNDPVAEAKALGAAREFWPENPLVPHLLGRKLSQKYRFAEGAARQREALALDAAYLPAQAQLANDLLRLGDTASGWDLVQQVHARDAYDVTAYNLATLSDTMRGFATLTNDHFVVRMDPREAEIYGDRALGLLERARSALATKYGVTLQEPTTVEIFAKADDFGVRTFGMPDNPGYLGVCFGRVITANSPAATRGKSINWESVLWHEFCHVVTLQLTANKMPRWLSEGISVYEERLANPAWGEQLNPQYREMILGEDLVPIGRLSAAFLTPKSGLHLQFAYYESSLVVEFLVERFGLASVRQILDDLRNGAFINDAIERHAAKLATLEKDFAEFARDKAMALGPDLDWDRPRDRDRNSPQPAILPRGESGPANSNNYWLLMEFARQQVDESRWDEARPILERLLRDYPGQTGSDSAYALLARLHRQQGDTAAERAVLQRWSTVDAGATEAYARIMELAAADQDWDTVTSAAGNYLAVDPLVAVPYRFLALADERLGNLPAAIRNNRILLGLDPPNPAEVHFRLAELLHPTEPAAARRHLLQALEEAPRNREGLRRLQEWTPGPAGDSRPVSTP